MALGISLKTTLVHESPSVTVSTLKNAHFFGAYFIYIFRFNERYWLTFICYSNKITFLRPFNSLAEAKASCIEAPEWKPNPDHQPDWTPLFKPARDWEMLAIFKRFIEQEGFK